MARDLKKTPLVEVRWCGLEKEPKKNRFAVEEHYDDLGDDVTSIMLKHDIKEPEWENVENDNDRSPCRL